ncbi:MAG TPA: hypothetical protein VIK60_18360 [Vicinamibacterales bacterium]
MDAKRLVIGTLVGGVVLFVTGYLIFDLAFASFYAANAGSATAVDRVPQLVWAVALGSLSYSALITLGIGSRAASSIGAGAQIGAVVGFLLWFTVDFILYGITNIGNLTRTVVDPLLELVRSGIAGGVVAVVLAKIR